MRDLWFCLPVGFSQFVLVEGIFLWTEDTKRMGVRLTQTVVLCWAAIVVTAFTLSLCHGLYAFVFYAILAGVGMAFGWSRWHLLGFCFVAASKQYPIVLDADGSASAKPRTSINRRKRRKRQFHQWAWLGLAAFGFAQVILYSVVRLPCDWDSLAYHLPIVDHWIQYGRLTPQDCAFWYVPANSELITYWWVAGYSGDFWAGLTNLPVLILLVASTIELLVLLRVRMLFRFVAIVSILASQVVTRQLVSQENDVAVASLFMAAVMLG